MKLIQRIEKPEIIIGLVSPIGAEIDEIIKRLVKSFEANGYRARPIKVTDSYTEMVKIIPPNPPLIETPLFQRYQTYIDYGNALRAHHEDDSFLAALAIQQIAGSRFRVGSKPQERFERNAFILHQFKRPEEIDLLRSVYGPLFFQISAYSRRAARVEHLAKKFAESSRSSNVNSFRARAEELVETDENEVQRIHGQRVGKIFHDADLIINADEEIFEINRQVDRFCELLFSSNSITPNKMEYGMFAAHAAALRTSDLSRQVGAAILSAKGEIIAAGSNEVPKAGGGTYWSDEELDDRDFCRQKDSNDERKNELMEEILSALEMNEEGARKKLRATAFMDALEYGRIVHAEMNAITDAARNGGGCSGATLYTTTFPCHMCAKHIVAAGIQQVVFLEPYPKSLAARLHSDSVSIESHERGIYKDYPAVTFNHFYGITPRRYRDFFQRAARKDKESGEFVPYGGGKRPFIDTKYPAHATIESHVLAALKRLLEEMRQERSQ